MARTNSFKLLWEAIKSSRRPMWESVQVLIVLTIILATIFYFAERSAQPEEYNYGRSLIWAFTRYIDDPGNFSGPGPVTFVGRLVASFIGIVGIMIFAVPAGLIGSAFGSAIDGEIRKRHLEDMGRRLTLAFTRRQDPKTMFRYIPRYISIGTLQAMKNMTERDVIDAVEYNPEFRLRNLASSISEGSFANDQLVVEMFPYNIEYGCKIDRGSNVTIVCPSSISEAGIGNFGYYLAKIGGFNYVSKEIEPDTDNPISYYLIDDEQFPESRRAYLADLQSLSKGSDHWTIFLISSGRRSDACLHFVTAANTKTGRESTITNNFNFERLYEKLTESLGFEFGLRCELNEEYKASGSNNAAVRIDGGIGTNAFTIRISSEFVVFDSRYVAVCRSMAEVINSTVGNAGNAPDIAELKAKGTGY